MQTTFNAGELRLQSYSPNRVRHAHAFHQIVLPLHGALELETELDGDLVCDQTFAIVAAGREHAYRAPDENRILTIDVPDQDNETGAQLRAAASHRLFFPFNEQLGGLMAFARGCSKDAFEKPDFRSSLGRLIIHGLTAAASNRTACEPDALLRAKTFIHKHLADAISVQDIAGAAHVSIATLNRLFQTRCSRSPAKFLSETRLARAQELLTTTQMPIAQIAIACGYSEQSALCRAMRRELGRSPGEYRDRSFGQRGCESGAPTARCRI